MNLTFRLILLINFLLFISSNTIPSSLNTPEIISELNNEAYIVYSKLNSSKLSFEVFYLAYDGFKKLRNKQLLINDSLLTVIDYSLPSIEERLWVIDIKNYIILENTLVAHGKASGELFAESFSDTPQSHMSSLGFFITGTTYNGKHGYSLIIDGMEEGINRNAKKRSIVFHGANYVSKNYIQKTGRLGRSFGCPALPVDQNKQIIDLIKDESCVFIYSNDKSYLKSSKLISPRQFSQIIH